MTKELDKKLEAAGWKTGDAADFFGMTEEQRLILDTRVAMAKAVRQQRRTKNLTQKDLAALLHSTQPRVAKIESAAPDVSFDQLFKALVVLGGGITVHGPESIRVVRREPKQSSTKVTRHGTGAVIRGVRIGGKAKGRSKQTAGK